MEQDYGNPYSEIDTVVELFILLIMAGISILITGWIVRELTSFTTSYLERDKVMIRYVDIMEADPYTNLTAYEAYMTNWIMSDNIDMELATVAENAGNDYVILTTRENGHPHSNYSVYVARTVTGYGGTTPNVKDIIKAAPGGTTTQALTEKYRGINLRYTLDLTNAYHLHPSVPITNPAGQLLENRETYVWTLIPRSIP